ncbi:MAG TPA: DUF2157 domain-containing protein [Frankiaceae bacterium]|nr:DUF2157 domain-containing protein [Frankiaceae bacterium]
MTRTPISPRRLEWLTEQVEAWRTEGMVGDDQARAIRDRYEPNTRATLTAFVLALGAAFLGVGVLALIATNVDYDELSPATRFGVVAVMWLGFTIAGATVSRFGAPLRLLAALLFGGVIFQAAQSLNVPAYEPTLLAAWAGGAIALAYGTRSAAPLVIGVVTGVGWYVWTLVADAESAAGVVLGLALATPVLAAAAVAHRGDRLGGPWRNGACVTGLAAVFVAAFPGALNHDDWLTRPVYVAIAAALVATVAAAARSDRRGFGELAGAGGLAVVVLLLVAVAPDTDADPFDTSGLSGAALAHALFASAVFLAAAVGVASLGVARQVPGLVNLAAAALVLFVTLQSFGLFAPLLSGAGLFLLVGTLLVGSGLLVDRGRRRLREEIQS